MAKILNRMMVNSLVLLFGLSCGGHDSKDQRGGTSEAPPKKKNDDQKGNPKSLEDILKPAKGEKLKFIRPVDDATIVEKKPTKNYQTDLALYINKDPAYVTLVKFDTASIGSDEVESAKLYILPASVSPKMTIQVFRTGNLWSEETLVWDSAPQAGYLESSNSAPEYHKWMEFDVSKYIKFTGAYSFRIEAKEKTKDPLAFYSKDSVNYAPTLVLSTTPSTSTVDTTAPVISNVTVTSLTGTTATIEWTTDEASKSEVIFGTTVSYGAGKVSKSDYVLTHSLLITNLSTATQYHFQVSSKDAAGNNGVSQDGLFTTP